MCAGSEWTRGVYCIVVHSVTMDSSKLIVLGGALVATMVFHTSVFLWVLCVKGQVWLEVELGKCVVRNIYSLEIPPLHCWRVGELIKEE